MTKAQQQETPQLAIQIVAQDVEKIIHECGIMALKDQPAFIQAVSMARGIRELRKILTNAFIEETFVPLMGTPLGFITDKDKEPAKERYGVEVVRDCVIEALLRGFRPVGNEFNIIAGRFYGAKSGYERNVNEFPGVSEVRLEIGVPHLSDKGALVPVEASWKYHGKEERLECVVKKITTPEGAEKLFDTRIPVKVNAGMGMDAILGKAQRKMFARIYQRLTGCSKELIESEDEAETITTTGTALPQASADGRRISMKRNAVPVEDVNPKTGEVTTRDPGQEG